MRLLKSPRCAVSLLALSSLAACGPHAHIPPRGAVPVPDAVAPGDSAAILARILAPTLYLQRDETFPLSRVAAVVHPTRPIVAYHLLWRDDVHGAWIPFTVPTDEEEVWVGYDPATHEPTDLWSYWHGTLLHTDWRGKGPPAFDVQWGKHGSMPHGVAQGDLPKLKSLNLFYFYTIVGLPDIWLGNTDRKGPWCFCHGYRRYHQFTEPLATAPRLDVVLKTDDPRKALRAVFGEKYSEKIEWPSPGTGGRGSGTRRGGNRDSLHVAPDA